IHKGQVMTNYYRLINKTGGYTWLQTCATLISTNTSTSKGAASSSTPTPTSSAATSGDDHEQSIICVNYVLSAVEFNDVVMDTSQLNGGSVPNTPTPPVIHHSIVNKRQANHSIKRSLSSTPSPPDVSGGGAPLSHSTPDPHNNNTTHSQQQHVSHVSHGPPAPPVPTGPPLLPQAPTAATAPVVAVTQANGSPGSPADAIASDSAKRRRFNSSPVRPWKSPSPPPPPNVCQQVVVGAGVGLGGQESANSASSLLRHISVIRETPPILKPQVVAPAYHPAHHAHHYHHLVDPYAAAYHLYKNGSGGPPMTAQPTPAVPSTAAHHHWGAYN
ncbi:unnamed protein product, partial [Oppiella nova]